MKNVKNLFLISSGILILLNVLFASVWVLNGNIMFHTDIARDFLLIEDIVTNRNITLIGARAGGIPGVFHGPLWLYLNLPAFVLGGGNPVVVGWFWILLFLVTIFFTYYAAKKIFDTTTGVLSALLISALLVGGVFNLLNPFGALMLSPLFFYFLYVYSTKNQMRYLVFCAFILGCIIQFQMAFGLPLTVLSFIYSLYFILKKKKFFQIFSWLVLLLPLSTFILFDVRHDFLQAQAVMSYLSGTESIGKVEMNIFQLFQARWDGFLTGIGFVASPYRWAQFLFLTLFIFSLYSLLKKKKISLNHPYILFIYLYGGFWILTLGFSGVVWSYYYSAFIPLIIIVFSSLHIYIDKRLFAVLFTFLFIFYFQFGVKNFFTYNTHDASQDINSWTFNYSLAQKIFSEAKGEFGYYIYTQDQYGYPPRYAMNFTQKSQSDKTSFPYEKKPVTYLIIGPTPSYRTDMSTNEWKKNDVAIKKAPDQTYPYKNGFTVERYQLTTEETSLPSNPNLIDSIIFR